MNNKCPVCKRTLQAISDRKENEPNFLPFCSERCKLIDLGAWLEEEYKITSQVGPGEGEES